MTVHKLLLAYREKQGWMITPPPEPLVLHGWAYTNDLTKKDRWEETIAWATKFGCSIILGALRDEHFYCVDYVTTYPIGPGGGPMYQEWNFTSLPSANPDNLIHALASLKENWATFVDPGLSAITSPIKFSGKKSRLLKVQVTGEGNPPWGSWTSLSYDRETRHYFTKFRKSVNRHIEPHHVDHIDFMF